MDGGAWLAPVHAWPRCGASPHKAARQTLASLATMKRRPVADHAWSTPEPSMTPADARWCCSPLTHAARRSRRASDPARTTCPRCPTGLRPRLAGSARSDPASGCGAAVRSIPLPLTQRALARWRLCAWHRRALARQAGCSSAMRRSTCADPRCVPFYNARGMRRVRAADRASLRRHGGRVAAPQRATSLWQAAAVRARHCIACCADDRRGIALAGRPAALDLERGLAPRRKARRSG